MKYLASCLKSSNTHVIDSDPCSDSSSEQQSDISDEVAVETIGPIRQQICKTSRICSIRKEPLPNPRRPFPGQQIHLISDDEHSQSGRMSQGASGEQNVWREISKYNPNLNAFKRRLVKVSNKCKIEKKQCSSTECSICLVSLQAKDCQEIGRLPCKHAFCLECILQSSKFSNKCPYCRTPYKEIQNNGRAIAVEQKQYEQNDDPYDQPCYVCGRNDDFDHLLECEYCEAAFCHTYCDERLESDVPPEQSWYCSSCSNLLGH